MLSVRSETNRNGLEFANIEKEVQSREIKNPKSPISKIGYKTLKLQRNDNHLEEKIRKCEVVCREFDGRPKRRKQPGLVGGGWDLSLLPLG